MSHLKNKDDVLTKKRIVNHRIKQVETSIKRQVVIEDGKIISDSGPQVTTKTLEDSNEKFEEFEEFVVTSQIPATTTASDMNGIQRRPIHDRHNSYVCNNGSQHSYAKSTPIKTFLFGYDDQHNKSRKPSQANECAKFPMNQHTNKSSQKPTTFFYFGEKCASAKCEDRENSNKKTNANAKTDLDINNNVIGNKDSTRNDDIEQDCLIAYEYSNFTKEPKN